MSKTVLQIAMLIILFGAISAGFYYRASFNLELLEQSLEQAGLWAPVIFILIYIVATVLFLPGSVITLAGGIIFGPVLGSIYNLTGATIGAAIAFLIARYIASDTVEKRSGGKLKQLINGVESEGWRFVAFVRLVPLFPFNLLNYALGLTRIKFTEYLVATFIFMIPGGVAYTYLGYTGRQAVSGGENLVNNILIAIALLAMVSFIPRFIASIRRGPGIDVNELHKRLSNQQTVLLDVRSNKAFQQDGIRQGLNIPLEQLAEQIDRLQDHIEDSISIICTTDRRSKKAANILIKKGFRHIDVVNGGMMEWNRQYASGNK
jgi:uncharacterized membrane protein YdjX (TVP38/TMEM64 family)